jgi:hypothetical protein
MRLGTAFEKRRLFSSVGRWQPRMGIPAARAQDAHAAEITHETWEQIRIASAAGIGLRELSRKLNIAEGTFSLTPSATDGPNRFRSQRSSTQMLSVPQSLAAVLSERKEMSKRHSNLIRAATCARRAYFVDIGGMAAAIGVIRVEATVRDGQEPHAVTIDVNAA